jgi:hypothetical protein
MKEIRWNEDKNKELKKERNITFDQLISAKFIGIERHPKRPNQHIMLFEFKGYVWVVPYVDEGSYYFLKTAFPNRKYTEKYLGGN